MKGPWVNTVGILWPLQMWSAYCYSHRMLRASKANREKDIPNKAIWTRHLSKTMSHINECATKGYSSLLVQLRPRRGTHH